jgi:hypothetical protein
MESRASERATEPDAAAEPAARAAGAAGPAAQVLGLQRTIGNRRTAALVAGRPERRISRYKILGPFNAGQAVHETLTLLAVKQAKQALIDKGADPGELMADFKMSAVPDTESMFGYDPVLAHKSHSQFIRGVVWADDPEGLLFDNPRDTTNYSSGAMWYSHFSEGKEGKFGTMTARSHFGDLQFFHGMATSDAEKPATTKANMLNWARFLIKVAKGVIVTTTQLKDIAEVSSLFPNQGELTVKELFGWGKGDYVKIRQRAVGALFHMIQDSYAHGHVERNSAGEITEFHAYGGQDEHKHGEYDFLGGSWYQDLGERLKKTKGALSAIDACAAVLQMIAEDVHSGDIVDYIDKNVLTLAQGARPAGAGTGLEKPPPPPPKPEWLKKEPLYHPGKI